MEDVKAIVIPTGTKAKISHELSFPIGAEKISMALASTKQLPLLVLHFRADYYYRVRFGHYPFLRVAYSGAKKAISPLSANGIPLFNEWEIAVMPVPRVFRHRIQQYILNVALPQVKQWLDERVHLTHEGNDMLTFFFNEEKEEFVPEQSSHPQPIRETKRQD
jgi:hypothetical protein